MNILPVILSGGSGTRMWPLSRPERPKQFLSLFGQESLLQQTALRLTGVANALPPLVVTNREQRFLVAEQLQTLGVTPSGILLEPIGRNTAPAVTVAALWALAQQDDPLLLVLPSDHLVLRPDHFRARVQEAAPLAVAGKLVTFGIAPTSPHTGYGYIEQGPALPGGVGHAVASFKEKPDRVVAQAYLDSGRYLWNSGMFLFRASAFLQELERLQPDMLAACQSSLARAIIDSDFVRLDEAAFARSPSDSIDYAVMEHTRAAAVVGASDLGWSDIGSWSALAELSPQDADGNHLSGEVLVEDTRRCYVRTEGRLIAALGIEDLVIIDTADATLVAHRDRAQDVKKLVDRLPRHRR